jgi:hypothetical protein
LDFDGIDINAVDLYLDITSPGIIEILKNNKNTFKIIIREILLGHYNDSLYKKESGNVTAMKFSGNPNSRIYCLEVPGKNGEKKKIVMSKACRNKSVQQNDKKIKSLIESVQKSKYEYYDNAEDAKKHK